MSTGTGGAVPAGRTPVRSRHRATPRTSLWAVAAAALVGLVIGAGATTLLTARDEDPFQRTLDRGRAQAVVLANDKVYFGQIHDAGGEFYELRDAFFVQEVAASEGREATRTVVPLKHETHSPDNRMLIRKDQVVLVENLSPDSPVQHEISRQMAG